MDPLAFDPTSPGAQRLARTWLPHLERWEMRIPAGHTYHGDNDMKFAGETVDVPATHGRQLQTRGYELLGTRVVRARG